MTGQPLSPEQAKDVRNNSRMHTAAKVFIIVGIAAAAAFSAYVAYRVTHPPTLSMPTLPAAH